jgi:sulfotransferase
LELHFISGLPRAGSTLFAALLRQPPSARAGMTSPVGSLFTALLREMSQANETAVFVDDADRQAILRGLFAAYYRDAHPGDLVFDTNRLWCAKLPALAALFPEARIICCVRDVPWIMDSLESLIRRNPFELSRIFNFEPGGAGLVGFA